MYDTEMLIKKEKATVQQKDRVKQDNSPKLCIEKCTTCYTYRRRKQIWIGRGGVLDKYVLRNMHPAKYVEDWVYGGARGGFLGGFQTHNTPHSRHKLS